jgi:hypothetical protein
MMCKVCVFAMPCVCVCAMLVKAYAEWFSRRWTESGLGVLHMEWTRLNGSAAYSGVQENNCMTLLDVAPHTHTHTQISHKSQIMSHKV